MEIQSKSAKVIMLPTEQYEHNRILKGNKEGRLIIDKCENLSKQLRGLWTPQHIYITTDDKIEDGDWCLLFDSVGNLFSDKPQQYQVSEGHVLNDGLRKIVSTTDKLETGKWVGKYSIEKEYLPQPSKAFIEKYCKLGGIDEVEIEYEKLVKAYIPFSNAVNYILKVDSHNTITIHPIKYSWNKEEVYKEVIDFATEYSGISRDKVTSMYNKYKLNGKL